MRNLTTFILVVCSTLLGCSDEEARPSLIQNLTRLEKDNYWIYEIDRVGEDGSRVALGTDSVFVERDTTINGMRYAVLNYGRAYSRERFRQFLRPNADYLMSDDSTVVLTTDVNMELDEIPVRVNGAIVAFMDFRAIYNEVNPTLPGVAYGTTYGMEGTFRTTKDIPGIRSPRTFHTIYAPGIGRIFESYFMTSSSFTYEERLIRSSTLNR